METRKILLIKAWSTELEKWHLVTASPITSSKKRGPFRSLSDCPESFLRSPFRLKNGQQKPPMCREIIAPEFTKQRFIFRKIVNQNPSIYKSKFPAKYLMELCFPGKKNNMKRRWLGTCFLLKKNRVFDEPLYLKLLTRSWFVFFSRKSSDVSYETVFSCGKKMLMSK